MPRIKLPTFPNRLKSSEISVLDLKMKAFQGDYREARLWQNKMGCLSDVSSVYGIVIGIIMFIVARFQSEKVIIE